MCVGEGRLGAGSYMHVAHTHSSRGGAKLKAIGTHEKQAAACFGYPVGTRHVCMMAGAHSRATQHAGKRGKLVQ